MLRLSLGSWSSYLRMYSQSFLVSSVRGSGSLPTTAASAASGCTGLLRAFLGAAAFFGVGIGQIERAGLGSQAKNQPGFGYWGATEQFHNCSVAPQTPYSIRWWSRELTSRRLLPALN